MQAVCYSFGVALSHHSCLSHHHKKPEPKRPRDLVAPLINRNAIKAEYSNANARQVQAVYEYEQTILTAYIEVANQLANIDNLAQSYDLKAEQVEVLNQSIQISNDLFRSARADYMEVLMTQRDALESKFQLIELK